MAASRGVRCSPEFYMRAACGLIGYPRPRRPRRFRRESRVRPRAVRRSLSQAVSSSRELHAPSESSRTVLVLAFALRRSEGHLPWGCGPSSRHQPEATRATGVQPDTVPPSTFCASSTVCFTPGLAGLFRPAATYRVRSSGVFPPAQVTHLVGELVPSRRWQYSAVIGCPVTPRNAAPPTGLSSARESVVTATVISHRCHPIPS
jgi:hypothetical protein